MREKLAPAGRKMVEGRDGTTLCEGLPHTRARDCAALKRQLPLGLSSRKCAGREAGLDHWAGGSVKSAARATARTHLAVSRTRGGVAGCLVDVPPRGDQDRGVSKKPDRETHLASLFWIGLAKTNKQTLHASSGLGIAPFIRKVADPVRVYGTH